MRLTAIFLVEVSIVVLALAAVIVGAIVIQRRRRQGRPESTTETIPNQESYAQTDPQSAQAPGGPRDVYKSVSLETDWEMKIRLYSPDEYRAEFGSGLGDGFVGAAKGYRPVADRWDEIPPERAAHLMELKKGDYKVDAEHEALLLRRWPPGTPIEAIDDLL